MAWDNPAAPTEIMPPPFAGASDTLVVTHDCTNVIFEPTSSSLLVIIRPSTVSKSCSIRFSRKPVRLKFKTGVTQLMRVVVP